MPPGAKLSKDETPSSGSRRIPSLYVFASIDKQSFVSVSKFKLLRESILTLVPVQSSPGLIMGNQVFGNFKSWDLSL